MKTAKELLELRNKLKEEKKIDRMAESEWEYIENIIEQFKITDNSTYIEVPRVVYKPNRIKLDKLGFLIYDLNKVSKLYFDKDEYEICVSKEKQVKTNSVHTKSDSEKYPWQEGIYKLERDPNSPPITVKWHNHKGDYDGLLEKINECFKFY